MFYTALSADENVVGTALPTTGGESVSIGVGRPNVSTPNGRAAVTEASARRRDDGPDRPSSRAVAHL